MIPFLQQVAAHYFKTLSDGGASDLRDTCFIFPNRRSLVFFRKYLCRCAEGAGRPFLAPEMKTINAFFYEVTGADTTDRVSLLLKLYEVYKTMNPEAEALDDFIFWGDVILGDFNDVDKYLVDPKQLFSNISDLKAIEDTFDYLTDAQREAIGRFIEHFRVKDRKVTEAVGGRDAKKVFVQLWNIMYPLYVGFNKALDEAGMAYEGKVYRRLAEHPDDLVDGLDKKRYVFVGLNALNECEKKTLRKMRDAGFAEFCWDWSGKMIQDPLNKSSFFLSENVKEFPAAFEIDPEGTTLPEINVISVPSSTGQTKQLPNILATIPEDEKGTDTAIVLPDETLLMPVLNTIPPEIQDINVTMGYPISSSAVFAFMEDVAGMQVHLRNRQDQWFFYHKQVWSIFSNSVFKAAMDEEAAGRVKEIQKAAKYYIPEEDFKGIPLLEKIFRPVVRDLKATDQMEDIAIYQQEILSFLAPHFGKEQSMALETEFAKEYYKNISFLRNRPMEVTPVTWFRLLGQLVAPVSVPFQGEPLKGLQIMGPLEIRALDFKNLIILSSNEGMFPRRSVSSSFIPPELRKGFGLPTYEYQDAVWAYYFYRMISRAEKVWMVYDSRTQGMSTGEESRYIKQLRYHFNYPLKEYVAKAEILPPRKDEAIGKTAEHVNILKRKYLSASSLQNYLVCPARFYYSKVEGLSQEGEIAESLDASMIGTVYHNTMRALYYGEEEMMSDADFDKTHAEDTDIRGMETVTKEYLVSWRKRTADIRRKVMSLIRNDLKTVEVSGRDLVVTNVIVRYVLKTIDRDIEILEREKKDAFQIIGLEVPLKMEMCGLKFIGYVDRVDALENGTARVVDYKSGRDDPDQLCIDDGNAASVAELIFGEDKKKSKDNKAALQFYIYDRLMNQDPRFSSLVLSNSMYAVTRIFDSAPEIHPVSAEFCKVMDEKMTALLEEITDLEVPFSRTEDPEDCKYCDFRMICGR